MCEIWYQICNLTYCHKLIKLFFWHTCIMVIRQSRQMFLWLIRSKCGSMDHIFNLSSMAVGGGGGGWDGEGAHVLHFWSFFFYLPEQGATGALITHLNGSSMSLNSCYLELNMIAWTYAPIKLLSVYDMHVCIYNHVQIAYLNRW